MEKYTLPEPVAKAGLRRFVVEMQTRIIVVVGLSSAVALVKVMF